MRKIYQLGEQQDDVSVPGKGLRQKKTSSGAVSSFEIGLEVALALLEQFERRLTSDTALDVFFDSVRRLIRSEALIVLEPVEEEARVLFTHLPVSREITRELCADGGFYFHLARIRFTHFYDSRSKELTEEIPKGHPPIEDLLAVPLCRRGQPAGCLAAVNSEDEVPFGSTDAMLLSVGAAVLSLGREFKGKIATQRG